MSRTIKSQGDFTAVSELEQGQDFKVVKNSFLTKEFDIIIDPVDILRDVKEEVILEYPTEESFIAELDMTKDGVSVEHKEVVALIEEKYEDLINVAENELLRTATEVSEKYTDVILATSWTNERGTVSIKTKYFFHDGTIIMQQLKEVNKVLHYQVGKPTITGLKAMRGHITHAEEDVSEMKELHNNYVLFENGLEPISDTFFELGTVDESSARKVNYNSRDRKVWISYFDGLIQMVKNEHMEKKAEPEKKKFTESNLF